MGLHARAAARDAIYTTADKKRLHGINNNVMMHTQLNSLPDTLLVRQRFNYSRKYMYTEAVWVLVCAHIWIQSLIIKENHRYKTLVL